MTWSLIGHELAHGALGGTTTAFDTTGADLIVLCVSSYTGTPTVSDSQSNTWSPLTKQTEADASSQLYYCASPTTSSAHTFTVSSGSNTYDVLTVSAFSGSGASPFDVQNGAVSALDNGAIQPGSITPSVNGEMIISGTASFTTHVLSVDSGLTITDQQLYTSGDCTGGALAYFVQTTAAAINPTWSHSGSNQSSAVIASFKPAAGGGTSVALTGQSTTVGKGSFGLTAKAALSGQQTVSVEGSPGLKVAFGLLGQQTSVDGDVFGFSVSTALTGQETMIQEGTITVGGTILSHPVRRSTKQMGRSPCH